MANTKEEDWRETEGDWQGLRKLEETEGTEGTGGDW